MSASDQELLDATNEAIFACMKSQSYSVAERSQQRAQLQQLTDFRDKLLNRLQNSGPMCSLGMIDPLQ